ncbi:uncharacterized protein LOC134280561 isoform X2 [Saccostrea cucullata]|uniref:uncharacterized protein LOC134280561 isoform X2 n=1 Tax=Saccostrea cuccullata TaxID=36930 RepID=UPI002ED317CC
MSDFLCPRNLTEVHLASLRLGCSRDKYGNDQYLCLPNTKKTALVELCHNGIMGMIVKGNCLETNEGKVVRKNCSEFKNGCPETAFNSKDIYKYRACHEINKEFNCYLAEPSCPSRTPNAELSTPVGIYSTTDIRNHTTTHQMVESDGFESLLWVMAPILIFVLAILLTIGYVWRRRNRTNMKQNARVEELKPLQDEEGLFIYPVFHYYIFFNIYV